mgnify:CR=1 FL=1
MFGGVFSVVESQVSERTQATADVPLNAGPINVSECVSERPSVRELVSEFLPVPTK